MQSKSSYLDELAVDVAEKSVIRFEKRKEWLDAIDYDEANIDSTQIAYVLSVKNHERATELYRQVKESTN